MPGTDGNAQTTGTSAPDFLSQFEDALESLANSGPQFGADVEADEETPPPALEPTADPTTGSLAGGETADPVMEPEASPDADPTPSPAAAGAEPAPTGISDDPDELEEVEEPATGTGTGQQPQYSRRQYGVRLTEVETERDTYKNQAETATRELAALRGRPGLTDEQLAEATASVMDFIGMAPPVDPDTKQPTGEEPIFVRLDRQAKGDGIRYEDEQKQYAELVTRGRMIAPLMALARRIAWQETSASLVDPDLGMDEAAVAAAGSTRGWRQAVKDYAARQITEATRGSTEAHAAEIARLKADHAAEIKDLNRKLQEQSAEHSSQLAQARVRRGGVPVVSGGRPVPRANDPVAVSASSGSPTDDLANFFAESSQARAS